MLIQDISQPGSVADNAFAVYVENISWDMSTNTISFAVGMMVNNPEVSSFGLRLHYDSNVMAYTADTDYSLSQAQADTDGTGFDSIFTQGLAVSGHVSQADTANYDGLDDTSAFVKSNWAATWNTTTSSMDNWPGTGNTDITLFEVNFVVSNINQTLQFDFSADSSDLPDGYSLTAASTAGFTISVADYIDPNASAIVSGVVADRDGNQLLADTLSYFTADSQTAAYAAHINSDASYSFIAGLTSDLRVAPELAVTNDHMQDINVYDALDALKIAIGLNPSSGTVTGEQLIAADIDQSGAVNVYDALDILKAAIGLTTSNTPEWVFIGADADLADLTASAVNYQTGVDHGLIGGATTVNFTGILLGDVDGSYTADIV